MTPSKAFFDQRGPDHVTYLYKGDTAGDVRIELVDRDVRLGGRELGPARTSQPRASMTYLGRALPDEESAAPERQLQASASAPTAASSRTAARRASSALYDHIFPMRGKHSYGDGVGAPRKGHTHQGQDVMAKCGTPLVAARGGRVQFAGYQGAAGNYLVIDGQAARGRDYAYMHLTRQGHLQGGRPRLHRPADRRRRRDRRRTRAATCTSSSGPPPAGTRAASSFEVGDEAS